MWKNGAVLNYWYNFESIDNKQLSVIRDKINKQWVQTSTQLSANLFDINYLYQQQTHNILVVSAIS